jgi:signal transduction histidine kinase
MSRISPERTDRPDGPQGSLHGDPPLCGILVISEAREIIACSPDGQYLTGHKSGQNAARSINELPQPLREIIEQTFSTSEQQRARISYDLAEAGPFRVQVTTAPIALSAGKGLQVTAVLNDLTSFRNLQHHTQHLERLASIGTLSAGLAHEVKNALVAVKTFVGMLIAQNKDAELAGIVNHEIGRIDSLVSQMLRFAGPGKPTLSTVHLHEVLEHSLRLMEPHLTGGQIELRKALSAPRDILTGDSYQLEQAFLNLLFNAVEAMEPGGTLSITTELVSPPGVTGAAPSEPTQLSIRIKNTGSGISPEHLARLFDPFFTTKTNGTGLGLSITRRIIQEHGGTISVESTQNEGATFIILLPSVSS